MKFFVHFGGNFYRAALGIELIFDPDDREYAIGFFLGPLLLLVGFEPADR